MRGPGFSLVVGGEAWFYSAHALKRSGLQGAAAALRAEAASLEAIVSSYNMLTLEPLLEENGTVRVIATYGANVLQPCSKP